MNKINKDYKPLSPEKIVKPFFISIICIMLIFLATLIYLFYTGPSRFIKYQVIEYENQIIKSKKDFIQTAVDRVIQDIEIKEKLLLSRLEKENPSLLLNKFKIDSIIKEEIQFHIRNTKLNYSGYIWVNEIINYDGGDKYAIRLTHPNLPETEGMFLSTNMTDIKGNKPYLEELEGIKKEGSLFFTYWFKKLDTNQIEQKLTYARLYKKYNWIIATGIYLDDVDALVAAEIEKGRALLWSQVLLTLFVLFLSFIIAFITAYYFKKRIFNTIKFYSKEVEERENSLKIFNTNLEQLVNERTAQLKESELRYGSLFKKNQSVMLLLNPETGLIVDANQAAVNFYGYSFEKLTSMNIKEINILFENKTKTKLEDLINSKIKLFYFKHKIADGSVKDVEVYSEKILVEGKELLYSIIYDISELKKTQQELIIAKDKAEESDRLKSAFLTNMSHEIRTPMNGILGFSNLLKEPGLSGDRQQEYIKIIEKSGQRMLNIINDIIDISKIESGLMKVELNESNINEQIEYIYTFFKPEAEAKRISLIIKNELPASEAIINTDREKLYAILTNIVKNAIKHTNAGSIEIGYNKKGVFIEFYVKDTGIGIPEDRREAVFERFIQADITNVMARQGAGLGLSISKAFVESLGGKIWLESKEGVGTTFYFNLPYINNKNSLISKEENGVIDNVLQNQKLKILIAEDDEVSESLLSITLKSLSSEIIYAKTGVEAFEKFKNNMDVDLILMDIQMPEMNGYNATKIIRELNKDVIIIAQTAFGLYGDEEKALEVGCNDYIAKPINKNKLLDIIQKHFKK